MKKAKRTSSIKGDKPLPIERFEYAYSKANEFYMDNVELNNAYYNGTGHWTQAEINKLEAEDRPVTILNYMFKVINVLSGNEIQNRNDIHAFPTEGGDVNMANIINYGYKYVKQNNKLPWRFTQSNIDGYIGGMGWLKQTAELDEQLKPEIIIRNKNPRLIYADPDFIELDLEDMQDIHELQYIPKNKLIKQFPELEKEIEAFSDAGRHKRNDIYVNEKGWLCTVVYSEFKKYENRKYWMDGDGNVFDKKEREPTKEDTVTREGSDVIPTVYGVHHFGDVQLGKEIKDPHGCGKRKFSYTLLAPYFVNGQGISVINQVRSIQDIINKSYSQALDVLNRQPKVGGMFERGAVKGDNVENFREQSRTGDWREVEDIGKIKPDNPIQYPAAHMALVKDSIDLKKEILAIPDVFLGEAPGRVESGLGIQILRKQAGLSFEQPADNLRVAQIEIGRKINNQMAKFWSKNKFMRIAGEDGNYIDIAIESERIIRRDINGQTGEPIPIDEKTGKTDQIFENKFKESSKYDWVVDVNSPSVTQRMYNQVVALELFNRVPAPEVIPLLIQMTDFPEKDKWIQALTMGMQNIGTQPGGGNVQPPRSAE